MAENRNTDLLESYLKCHVCLETLREPVSLTCHHDFCLECLENDWQVKKSRNCPVCHTALRDFPPVNYKLKALADSFAGRVSEEREELEDEEGERGEREQGKAAECRQHKDETKMFCEDEQKIVCPLCDTSPHEGHVVLPLNEAAKGLKEQLKLDLVALKDKRRRCTRLEREYKDMLQHSKIQALSAERHIRAEFSRLHSFLEKEQEFRLTALREDEERCKATVGLALEQLQVRISSFSDCIACMEFQLQRSSVSFLKTYRESRSTPQDQCLQSVPWISKGALLDTAKHVGNLAFNVWQKMKDEVQLYPVVLDPNTAGGRLWLSEDLTTLRGDWNLLPLPDNPERYIEPSAVLGHQGFSSGRHSWDVEVGNHSTWVVGVARESAERKEDVDPLPSYGMWCLCYTDYEYTIYDELVEVAKNPETLRVQVDFDKGEVSFFDAKDMTHIHTHKDTFTEKLFPFFSFAPASDTETADIRIRPVDVSLAVEKDGDLQVLL